MDDYKAHDLKAALRFHKHPLTQQAAERIAGLEAALGNLVSALGAPDCGAISEAAEAACNHAIDVLAKGR